MPARLPVSASAVAYRIKTAYAGKIVALYWPASKDSVHALRPGENITTILTRTANAGSTYNETDGLIGGTVGGTTTANYFAETRLSGLTEAGAWTMGVGYYGDLFNGITNTHAAGAGGPLDPFLGGACIKTNTYSWILGIADVQLADISLGGSDDVQAYMHGAVQSNPANTPRNKVWSNGVLQSIGGGATTPGNNSAIGTAGRPFYFGGSSTNGGNASKAHFEYAFLGNGTLTDADIAAIHADPSVLIEVATVPVEMSGGGTFDVIAASGGFEGGSTMSGAPTLSDLSAAGAMEGPNLFGGSATLSDLSASGAISSTGVVGSITSEPLRTNNGTLLANTALSYVAVYNVSTGELVVRRTGLSTNALGVFSFSDPTIFAGVQYRVDWETVAGQRRMPIATAA